jgi:hypothetical protein
VRRRDDGGATRPSACGGRMGGGRMGGGVRPLLTSARSDLAFFSGDLPYTAGGTHGAVRERAGACLSLCAGPLCEAVTRRVRHGAHMFFCRPNGSKRLNGTGCGSCAKVGK